MANTFLTPDIIAREALATLYDQCVMAQLVHRDYDVEFTQNVGDTITIRKPTTFTANDFNPASPAITVQDATESSVSLTLNKFKDVSFAVTTKDLALNIQDFATQLLNPAMEALVQQIDIDLLSLRSDITQTVGDDTPSTGTSKYAWDNPRVIAEAGRVLNQAAVPMTNRSLVAGPITSADWLTDDLFVQAQQAGSTDGLRQASLGASVFGFAPYMTQHIAEGTSTTEVSLAFHETAFALAMRTLPLPQGAKNAAIQSYNGLSIRVVYDYDITKKQDIVSLDVLYGVKTLDPARACLIQAPNTVSAVAPKRSRSGKRAAAKGSDNGAADQADQRDESGDGGQDK
jgi:hypothetical protein